MCRVRALPVGDQRPAAASPSDGRGGRGRDAPESLGVPPGSERAFELLPEHLRDALRRTVERQVERHARVRASMPTLSPRTTTPRRRP